ncbi:RNA-binding (RRM/RBD/RNP motifs) family protein [Raphanus sativus]|uniref:Protein IFH1-like n=1 Tax=Raphanus sativus TaxID=3726 RepID=A0A9W3CPY0_RAPSA|nr:protein IFH1-like [Raphanus sativus]KAJ4871254.1 RNA-binding (RRM/RBD/RNP motifs) family protein [Raphanus sativus]
MNGASLCNSLLLHSRFKSPCSIPSSSSPYLISPCFTTSAYISFPRAVVVKRSDGFRPPAVNKRRSSTEEDVEEEEEEDEEDWDEFDEDGDEDEDEGEFLPMDKMKQWLEKKPRGFGVGKKYETSIEDKLLEEIEQSWKAQAANLNNLKTNDPLKRDHNNNNNNNNLIKGETQSGYRVRVTNLPKKKNVHRDLKAAFKEVSGVLNIAPAVSGNKKTKDPVCKGFALVDFKTGVDANRFVEQFDGQRLSFGKVVKQIKCQVVEFAASNQSVSEELRSDTVFEELPFPGFEAVSSVDVVEEDASVDSWEDESSDDSDKDVDEVEEEEECIIESPKVQTNVRSKKQAVKRETREQEELETPLVSFQALNKPEEAVAEAHVDDDDDDEHDRSDEEEEVAEENLEPLNSSVSSLDEERIERIRRLELKLLGREKVLGGGAVSDKPEAKTGGRVEGEKKKEKKKKKKKILVKGKKSSTIEIPGSSKRLKMKEKALLTGVLVKYAAKAASTSNDE